MAAQQPCSKPWRSFEDQVNILIGRGLRDAEDWEQELKTIGYYRLSGYWYIFRQPTDNGARGDQFYPDATMANVVSLYRYDEQLRFAAWEAITRIELALRVQIGYELGKIDPYVHLQPSLLDSQMDAGQYSKFKKSLADLQSRSREDFVTHFQTKYDGRLPIWVVTEILQFGQLIRLYEFAPYKTRVAIAADVRARADEYLSWLKALNIVRNISAHHGRLWNRSISMKPQLQSRPKGDDLAHAAPSVNRVYGVLAVMAYLLREFDCSTALDGLKQSILPLPTKRGIHPSAMGLPAGWENQPLWAGGSS